SLEEISLFGWPEPPARIDREKPRVTTAPPMPNQREIARALGIAQITVSRALSNSPLVTDETRRQVLAVAKKMGYRANPYVTALMANIRSGRRPTDQGCLALVSDTPSRERMFSHTVFRTWWEHLEKRANLRRYRVEIFLTGAPGMSGKKVNRILIERGTRAVGPDPPARGGLFSRTVFRTWWEHLQKPANLRGYRAEIFLTGAPGMSGKKVNRILIERGIRGVIIGNCSNKFFEDNRDVFDW